MLSLVNVNILWNVVFALEVCFELGATSSLEACLDCVSADSRWCVGLRWTTFLLRNGRLLPNARPIKATGRRCAHHPNWVKKATIKQQKTLGWMKLTFLLVIRSNWSNIQINYAIRGDPAAFARAAQADRPMAPRSPRNHHHERIRRARRPFAIFL